MSQSLNSLEEKFEHPIYCSTLISNNACYYEIEKLNKFKQIYYDFPYNKQLFFISHIDDVNSKEIQDLQEIQKFYETRDKQSEVLKQQTMNQSYIEYFKSANQNQLQKQKPNNDKWRKVLLDYYIEENGRKVFLKDYNVVKKEDIYQHMKNFRKSAVSEVSQQSQNEESENPQKNNDIEVLDGIYYFVDFLDKRSKSENSKLMEEYVEKVFDQFNKSVIYSFLSYFVSSCIQKMISKDILLDIDLRNFVLIRDSQNIKFVYLISFEDFKIEFEKSFNHQTTSKGNKEQVEFNYGQFCAQYYYQEPNNKKDNTTKIENKVKPTKLNQKFSDKYKQLLKQVADCLLNKDDIKEAQEDSDFAKECLDGVSDIEEALKSQDARKRYCKVLINKNHLLTALQNQEALKVFKTLYEMESQSDDYFTSSEILNSFFQDCLKKANAISDFKFNDKEKDTLVEFICEEYPRQQNGILQNTANVPSRERSKMPWFIQFNKKEDIKNEVLKEHEIISISLNKREMQIQLKIKESKHPIAQENLLKQRIEELKQEEQKLKNSKKDDAQKTSTQLNQISEQLKSQEQQLNALLNQAPIRGGEKKIMIDFKENNCSISIKLYYQQELFVLYENVDEMLYCIQLLNNSFNDISIYMDDNKRIYFETYVCMGQSEKALLRTVYMIDQLITYALTFFDFYYQNMTTSKSSRDISKYIQLQQEIQQYMKSYKFKFDDFVNKLHEK